MEEGETSLPSKMFMIVIVFVKTGHSSKLSIQLELSIHSPIQ